EANTAVNPTFFSPYTTTYIPIEKKTIAHGALFIITFVSTVSLFREMNRNIIAILPATNETGTPNDSLVKYPINKATITTHDKRNRSLSLIASTGSFKKDTSYERGILFRKKVYKTIVLAIKLKIFGTIILIAYSANPMLKKSAATIFTKLL